MGRRALTTLALLLWNDFTGADGFPLTCTYVAQDADAELASHAACAAREGERRILAPRHLRQMRYETDGLASVWVAGQWYDVQPSRAVLPVVTLDKCSVRSVRAAPSKSPVSRPPTSLLKQDRPMHPEPLAAPGQCARRSPRW